MKKAIFYFDCCRDCPYFEINYDLDDDVVRVHWCLSLDKSVLLYEIDSECPLEDDK